MDIPVFYWHQNFGFGSREAPTTWMMRFAQLEEQLTQMSTLLSSSSSSSSAVEAVAGLKPIAIFVAPEYLFRPQTIEKNTVTALSYSEQEKQDITRSLGALSAKFPGVLMFCGTVVWRKGVDAIPSRLLASALAAWNPPGQEVFDEEDQQTDIFYDAFDPTALHQQAEFERRAKYAAGIGAWHAARKSPKKGAPARLFREPAMVANIDGFNQQQTYQQKIAALQAPELKYLVKNTCFVYLNGELVLKYSKQNDFHETYQNASIQFVPGTQCPTINIWGHTLAMMICADYNDRHIKTYVEANAIIWVTISDSLSVTAGEKLPPTKTKSGFAAHIAAAGDEAGCKLFQRSGKGVADVPLKSVGPVLLLGILPIPLR
ncbi:hypothetical protein [Pseudomonas sp. NPDC096950]|uniref:hypothetical protein n=1 Tax=Pseudomonas sp. NPDC096950 TaxID=3364485 RepID=UPI00383AFBC1